MRGGVALDDPLVALAADRIKKGSRSFAGAARLFDPATRASAFMLYAWCRHCDDEIDGQVLGFERQTQRRDPATVLAELRSKSIEAMRGNATDPIYRCLQRVVETHDIPAAHVLELIRGMEMDVEMEEGRRIYRSRAELIDYCYHVAGVVGVMMAMVMGVRERDVLLRASDLGIAFQLTNIVRDIVADAEIGRVYVPLADLHGAGLDASTLGLPSNRPALYAVAQSLLEEAERYYDSANAGLPHLPFRSAWAVAAARRVYRDIGGMVSVRRDRAWERRVSTSSARKFIGVVRAAGDALAARALPKAQNARTGLYVPESLAAPNPRLRTAFGHDQGDAGQHG